MRYPGSAERQSEERHPLTAHRIGHPGGRKKNRRKAGRILEALKNLNL
jgi:hypothetical protein